MHLRLAMAVVDVPFFVHSPLHVQQFIDVRLAA